MANGGFATWQVYAAATAACAALSAGLGFTAIQPGLEAEAHRAELRADLSGRRQKAADFNAAVETTRVQLLALQDDLAKSPLHLEPASKINQRLAAINELATEKGLVFEEVRPGAASDAEHFKSLPIHISGSGTYPACTAFLYQLRKAFPDTGVSSLEAATQTSAGKSSNILFKLELVWYTKK